MNLFADSLINEATTTFTENGDVTYSTSLNSCVDFFFKAGAIRMRSTYDMNKIFAESYDENPDITLLIALWMRDAREGAGERKVFREFIKFIENQPVFENRETRYKFYNKVVELGRFDDLFSFVKFEEEALRFYAYNLGLGNGLAFKWLPREKSAKKALAKKMMKILGMNPVQYRKMCAQNTNVVENFMCSKRWSEINYEHVPSVASSRYAKAFRKNDETRYQAYLNDVSSGLKKINTSALYPYDVIKSGADEKAANVLWNNLPDYVPEEKSFFPIIDMSGSMCSKASPTVSCMDVAMSLGVYVAERNKSAFKDLYMTFSDDPTVGKLKGKTIIDRLKSLDRHNWGGSTNLDAAMQKLVDIGVKNKVPNSDMPTTLIVFSDMEFNAGSRYYNTAVPASERTKKQFTDAGYEVPNIVWWNIRSRGDTTPARATDDGMALVSGFSPSIMKNVLRDRIRPIDVMLDTVCVERYRL
jgi:hypothetical protein